MHPPIILASTSVYRKQLLAKTGLEFSCGNPHVDETPHPGECASDLVGRLALEKARSLAISHAEGWIIGSDQVCEVDGQILGKPGNHARAVAQLRAASGKVVTFHTGLCLWDCASGRHQLLVEPFRVVFRALADETIERYLSHEQPYDCAGSFKSEGMGICLFKRLDGRDPNTLIGLPLIGLVDMLAHWGLILP